MWDVTRWYCQGTCECEGVGVIGVFMWGVTMWCCQGTCHQDSEGVDVV